MQIAKVVLRQGDWVQAAELLEILIGSLSAPDTETVTQQP